MSSLEESMRTIDKVRTSRRFSIVQVEKTDVEHKTMSLFMLSVTSEGIIVLHFVADEVLMKWVL